MKQLRNIFYVGLSALSLSACSGDDVEMEDLPPQELTDIQVVAPDLLFEKNSRLVTNLTDKGFSFQWESRDVLGIMPDEGSQVSFPIEASNSERPNYARFTGGGWALKASSTYAAYFPYTGNPDIDRHNIPVNYAGQCQRGNNDYSHLGDYSYMAANASTPENSYVDFKLQHLGCYGLFEIATPEPMSFSSVTFCSDEQLFMAQGKLDMTKSPLGLEPVVMTDSLTFDLEGVSTTAEQPQLTLSFMFAPSDWTNKKVKAVLRDLDGYEEEVEIQGKNMLAGWAYKYPGLSFTTYPKAEKPNWTFDDQNNPYQMGMTAIVTVPQSLKKLQGEGDELAAFVNGELRGVGKLVDGIYYLLVHGNIGEMGKVSFRYFNQKKSYLYEAKDLVEFNTEKIFGVTENPVELPLVRM